MLIWRKKTRRECNVMSVLHTRVVISAVAISLWQYVCDILALYPHMWKAKCGESTHHCPYTRIPRQAPWATVDVNWFYINENELNQIPEHIKAGLAAERLPHRTKQVLMTMQDVRKSEIAEKAWKGGAAVEVGLWGSLQRQHELYSALSNLW